MGLGLKLVFFRMNPNLKKRGGGGEQGWSK